MFTVIILFASIVGLGCTYFQFQQLAKYSGSTLLGVTLTPSQSSQSDVLAIISHFKKRYQSFKLIYLNILFFNTKEKQKTNELYIELSTLLLSNVH